MNPKKSKYIDALHQLMQVQNPLIEYCDDMSQDVILQILNDMEKMMDESGEALKITRKAFNIITECLQNITRYSAKTEDTSTLPIFILDRQADKYLIASGNLVKLSKVNTIKQRIDDINAMDWYGVQQAYKIAIKAPRPESIDKNSAGLGFIDMARKSEQKFIYDFIAHDNNCAYFLLIVTLAK